MKVVSWILASLIVLILYVTVVAPDLAPGSPRASVAPAAILATRILQAIIYALFANETDTK
jgi:hypothetical protein